MDLEETKKIIQNKIEAEALTKNVRSQIKTYIHEKQNMREGFKETFQPLIESQDKVKGSIDNQQNAMIKQLQENQLALSEGLDKNRLAITQGFDKMDEVKKWDLQQLPGYEAIEEEKESEEEPEEPEEPEEDPEDEAIYRISYEDLNKIAGYDRFTKEGIGNIKKKDLVKFLERHGFQNQNKYEINIVDQNTRLLKVMEKPIIITYDESDMDKYLNNKESKDLLDFYSLKKPSYYKDKSLKELQEASKKSTDILSRLKNDIKGTADYNYDSIPGTAIAFPKSGEAKQKTKEIIKEYNIMEIYVYNLNQLRLFKGKTGSGILHFNNPIQLLDRLELLIGSILVGNNGVIQEFSQIAHLLNQMKVITKKQLNDLLKKYILNK